MVLTFPTTQAALDALDTDPRITVYIGGVITDVTHYDGQHGTDQEIATGKLQVLLPRPEHITPLAAVEVQAGHNDLVGTVFSGYIPNWEGSLSERGELLDITMVGWAALLAEGLTDDVEFQGPISARAVFVALCEMFAIPSYLADATTYPDGVTEVMLGGNPQVNDGKITLKANQSPLSQFNRWVEPYGYRVFDAPNGTVVLRRVSGLPNTDPVITFIERYNLGTVRRGFDTRGIINYHDVQGVTFEDEFGGKEPIRSRPISVTPNPTIPGDGIRYKATVNSDLVRQDQADAVRNVLEIDTSAPYTPVRWTGVGLPGLMPGDVVDVDAETVEGSGTYWLTDIDLTFDDGFTGSYAGWAGAGIALPSLNERHTLPIQTGPVHLGDEYVAWYAVPAHQGIEKTWAFSIPEKASVVNVRGYHHSTNSQTVAGQDTELEVSGFEIWKAGVDRKDKKNRAESTGKLPRMPEEYGQRRNYAAFTDANPGYWSPFAINLDRLDPGDYVLVLKAGNGGSAIRYDDFEARAIYIEYFGTVEPAVITEGA